MLHSNVMSVSFNDEPFEASILMTRLMSSAHYFGVLHAAVFDKPVHLGKRVNFTSVSLKVFVPLPQ